MDLKVLSNISLNQQDLKNRDLTAYSLFNKTHSLILLKTLIMLNKHYLMNKGFSQNPFISCYSQV